jgi:hypothetical protein
VSTPITDKRERDLVADIQTKHINNCPQTATGKACPRGQAERDACVYCSDLTKMTIEEYADQYIPVTFHGFRRQLRGQS